MKEHLIESLLGGFDVLRRRHLLREEMQHLILKTLAQVGFFEDFAFVGGTALRILYGLRRFSEDLDFSALPGKAGSVSVARYFTNAAVMLKDLGFLVRCKNKFQGAVQSSFLSFRDLLWRIDSAAPKNMVLAIRVEADCNPPNHAVATASAVQKTYLYNVRHFDLPSLFAGKLHALLCRKYAKGRDWYDFVWYRTRRVPVNGQLLAAAYLQTQKKELKVTSGELDNQLKKRIKELDLSQIKRDAIPFLEDASESSIFSREILDNLTAEIQII